MVKIIDGYKRRQEDRQRYDTILQVAKEVFGDIRISNPGPGHQIIIYTSAGYSGIGSIGTISSNIQINGEDNLEKAIELAEKYEKIFNQEWQVEHGHKKPE